MIKVGIVDDHPLYRQGLSWAVEQAEDLELVASARSIEDWDGLGVRADVVLLDLNLPGLEGSAGVAHVRESGPAVLVVSAAATPERVVDAIGAGASGYVTKDVEADDIVVALRTVGAGQMYVSPTLASYLLGSAKPGGSTLDLTAREREVLALLASGETDKGIAAELLVSISTVRSHLERIRDKTGARRRAELTTLAHQLDLSPERPKRRDGGRG